MHLAKQTYKKETKDYLEKTKLLYIGYRALSLFSTITTKLKLNFKDDLNIVYALRKAMEHFSQSMGPGPFFIQTCNLADTFIHHLHSGSLLKKQLIKCVALREQEVYKVWQRSEEKTKMKEKEQQRERTPVEFKPSKKLKTYQYSQKKIKGKKRTAQLITELVDIDFESPKTPS